MAEAKATRTGDPQTVAGQISTSNVLQLDARTTQSSHTGSARTVNVAESFSNMGQWYSNLVSGEVTWSDALYRIHGEEPGAFAPTMESVLAYCHADDRSYVDEIIRSAAEANSEFEVDYRIVRSDGQFRTIICKGQPEFDEQSRMVAMFGVVTDVTEAFDAIRSINDQKEMLDLAAQLAHLGH